MTDAVDRTLQAWRQGEFIWGTSDCLISLADYVFDLTGYDGGEPFRGRYDDEAGAWRLLEQHGGGIAVFDRAPVLERTDAPARGDIVFFDVGDSQPIGALCTGRGIAARRDRGTAEIGMRFVRIVAAWKIGAQWAK